MRLDRRHYNAWYGIGLTYYKQERFQLAEIYYRCSKDYHNQELYIDFLLDGPSQFLQTLLSLCAMWLLSRYKLSIYTKLKMKSAPKCTHIFHYCVKIFSKKNIFSMLPTIPQLPLRPSPVPSRYRQSKI